MTVKIHTPTIHEVTQAVYNLNATEHLMKWHEWLKGELEPIMYSGFVEHNPLAHAPRPLDLLDQPGDLVLDDIPMTILHVCDKDGNPVDPVHTIEFTGMFEINTQAAKDAAQAMLDRGIVPFVLREPDAGVYYMVKTEEVNGQKYSFFRPCHPSEKPEEGERLERYEKPLRLPPQAQIDDAVLTTLATAYGIRTPLPEGSFEQPTVTQHGWGPANFQFKF